MDIRLIWLALGSFAIGVEAFVVPALLPQIAAESGVTLVQAGLLVLVFSLTYAIGAPILAALSGSSDRRNVLVASALVLTAGAILASLSVGLGVLILARIVIAMAAGLYAATAQATAVSMSEPHQRGRAVSIVVGGTTLAVAFGAPLGAWMAQNLGWRGTYAGIAVLGLIAALSILIMIPSGIRGNKLLLRERLAVLRVPGVLPALAIMTLYMAGGFTILVYIAPLAIDAVGVDSGLLPAVLLSMGVGAAIGNIVGGQLADRWGATTISIAICAINVISLASASLVPLLTDTIIVPSFIAYMFIWGVAAWSFLPAQVMRILTIAPAHAPLALALNGSALYAGAALGAVVGGQVISIGSPLDLGWVAAFFPLAGLAVLWLARPRT